MVRRKNVWGSIGTLVLGATLVTGVAAQSGLPGSGWFTSATIQNVTTSGNQATVNVTAYGQGASGGTYTGSTPIPAGGSKTFLPGGGNTATTFDLSTPLPTGFVGSMVVESTEPVVAVSQVGNNQVGSLGVAGGRASAIYRGTNTPGTVLTYPTVKNSFGNPGKITVFSVQAAGADVTYSATIKSAAGGTFTKNGSIAANRSVTLLPSDFGMPSGCAGDPNTAACIGSLTVTATGGNIAGAVVETVAGAGVATQAQSTSLFSAADASNSLFCPVVKNDFDQNQRRFGGITVQNMGSTQATVNLELTYSGPTASLVGTKYRSSIAIPGGASRTFLATLGNLGGLPANSYASAQLTTTGSIIASVNESNFFAPVSAQKATTYSCFAPANATAKVALPQVKEAFGATPATTGVSVQNVGGVATVVNLDYVCQGKANQRVSTVALASGAGQTFFLSPAVQDNSLCAVTATAATAGSKIVGIAQESSDPFGGALDTKNYEGFNLQ